MNRHRLARFPFLLALAITLAPAWLGSHAQAPEPPLGAPPVALSPEPQSRPKIGLALSGGGARGAAHIGVLRVLEELHVPVDFIAGTSMGAVVGGLYASGMSPDEIEKALKTMDWDVILSGKPARKELAFRRKEDEFQYPDNMEMGLKGGRLSMPMGFISGQNFEFALSSLTLGVARVGDFDRLPIPFRCTATDIVTGESIVLSKGNLAIAIRASMSLPGIFPPVDLDDRLLVDGGLKDNLPVDVAKAMGADIVIAVNVGTPPAKKEDLNSYFSIAGQMISLLQQDGIRQQAKMADLLIQPDLQGIGMASYEKMGEAATRGETAARNMAGQLGQHAISVPAYAALLQARRGQTVAPLVIDEVKFVGDGKVDPRIAERRIGIQPGKPLDTKMLRRDLTRIWNVGDYESVTFQVRDEASKTELLIKAIPKPWGPNYLQFGLNLQTDLSGHSYFNLLAGITKLRINSLGAEWRNDLQVGRTNMAFTEFYQPLSYRGDFFVSAWGELRSDLQDVYSRDDRVAEYMIRQPAVGLDLGVNLSKYGEFRVGPVWRHIRAFPDVGSSFLPKMDANATGVRALFVADRLDNANFPNDGRYSEISFFEGLKGMGGDFNYRKLEMVHMEFFKAGKNVVEVRLSGGSSFGSSLPPFDQFSLGGFFSFSGYKEGQLRGDYFGALRLAYFYRVANVPAALGRGLYLGGFVDAGKTWWDRREAAFFGMRYSATLFAGVDTRLGPLYLAYGQAKDGNSSVYLSLGRSF